MKCEKCQHESPPGTKFCSNCGTRLIPLEEKALSLTETLQTPMIELAIGSTFAKRYQIIEELGRGGMGSVYKVMDKEIGERVALKLLKPEIASDERMIERFRNELKLARKITHKNVCRMYDLSKEEKTPYITMEYVSGEDLKGSLRRMGPLSAGKTIHIAKQVCDGLAEAHKLGVVHRDLKPQNIMIDKQGNAHIMDFGIARSLKAKGVTTSGMMIGTPDYMSPEQVEGKEVDQRADIYAMGVILFEMVTGTTPFKGETAVTIALMHTREKPPNPSDINDQIPEELSQVILKCMEKEKAKRYQNAEDLTADLDNIEHYVPTTDRMVPLKRPSTSRAIRRKSRLKKIFVPAFIIIGLAIAALIITKFTPLPEMLKTSSTTAAPAAIDRYLSAADQLWKEGKYSEAYSQFKKALEVDSNSLTAQLGLANALKEQGKPDEAIPEYEKAITLNDKDNRAYGQLGLIYEQKNEWSQALNSYKKFLETAPQGPEYDVVSQRVKDLESQIQAAAVRPKRADLTTVAKKQEPKKQKSQPVKTTSSKPETPEVSSKLKIGIDAFDREDFDRCITQMNDVLKMDPKNTSAQYFLSEAKKRKSEREKEQTISNKLRAAQNAYQRGNYQQCISEAEEVLKLSPGHTTAQGLITEAKRRTDEINKEQQIRDGLKRAQEAFQTRNYSESISQARRVLNLDSANDKAQEYIRLSNEQISLSQINAFVSQYSQSVNNKTLLDFYKNNCSPQCYDDIKKDAELMITYFDNLQSTASNIEIRFKGENQAEVTFANNISGTSKAGAKQDILKGVYKWDLEKQGDSWKITGITFTPRG